MLLNYDRFMALSSGYKLFIFIYSIQFIFESVSLSIACGQRVLLMAKSTYIFITNKYLYRFY